MRDHSGRLIGLGKRAAAATLGALLAVAALPGLAAAEEPIDRELDKYWNVNQKVDSLKNPLIERAGGLGMGCP